MTPAFGAMMSIAPADVQKATLPDDCPHHEKGSKMTSLPCHHRLDEMLEEYTTKAGISKNPKGWLFRAATSKNGTALTDRPMCQQDVHTMIRKRAAGRRH